MMRRSKIAVAIIFISLFGLAIRISILAVDESVKSVGLSQGSRTITVAEVRGTIYDRYRTPLVNDNIVHYATILPQERLLQHVAHAMDSNDFSQAKAALDNQLPLLLKLHSTVDPIEGLQQYTAPMRYGRRCLAPHLIGYLNGANTAGVSGLEKAYDNELRRQSGHITTTYPTNGRGEYLVGEDLRIENTIDRSRGGLVLTLDSTIQKCIEDVLAANVSKGAAVVMNLNGELLASASYPSFRPENAVDHFDLNDGSLLNRAFSLYDCGSVFKIVTVLAALENGVSPNQSYECPGSITVDGHIFHCHQRLGHQWLTMDEAFAQSCNVYFIQLAQQIGANTLLDMVDLLGLNEDVVLANDIVVPSAVLPSAEDLSAPAALANFSFGQGRLMITPLHVTRMTAVAATGGILPSPSVVMSVIDEQGNPSEQPTRGGETVISARSALKLRHMMETVVSDGTGKAAQTKQGNAAGKTGTAETGQIDHERTINHSWFTGYYPADTPKYIITVLVEDHQPNQKSAAGLFCEIINNLNE